MLAKIGPKSRPRDKTTGPRRHGYATGGLEEAREAFMAATGITVEDWSDDDGE
jgi:hypothetical protein